MYEPDAISNEESGRRRRRSAFVAVVIVLICTPFVGMLYLGKATRAFAYLGAEFSAVALALFLASRGLWISGVAWWVPIIAIRLIASTDAASIAYKYRVSFIGPWYSRWYGIIGATMLLTALIYSPRIFLTYFYIPSGAMMPNLLIGDHIVVSKYSNESHLRQIERGDVVAFFSPRDPSTPFLKRVVGLPGDRITYFKKNLSINGENAEQKLVGYYDGPGSMAGADVRLETIADRSHLILVQPDHPSFDGHFTVPSGHYFVLGDNRDNSLDSRYIGTVPSKLLIGYVSWIFWNTQLPHRVGPFPDE